MSIQTRSRWLAYSCLVVVLAACCCAALLRARTLPDVLPPELAHLDAPALFSVHCAACHDTGRTRIEIDGRPTLASVHQEPALWRKISRALRDERMPPPDMPCANPKDRERMIAWIESGLAAMDGARVAARRISSLEYRNALRDLFDIETRLASTERSARGAENSRHVFLPADFPA